MSIMCYPPTICYEGVWCVHWRDTRMSKAHRLRSALFLPASAFITRKETFVWMNMPT